MDCEQILLNTLFAFLSAFIGTLMGVYWAKCQFHKQNIFDRQQLRSDLIKSFRFNVDRLNQMSGQLSKVIIPDYRLDTESLTHILFHGRELFDNPKWFDRFNWERYQLVHVNAKIDFLNDITNLSGFTQGSIFSAGSIGHSRITSLTARLPTLVADIEKLIAEYEAVKTQ